MHNFQAQTTANSYGYLSSTADSTTDSQFTSQITIGRTQQKKLVPAELQDYATGLFGLADSV